MKTIILSSILFLFSYEGFSKCSSRGFYFWPSDQTINKNSIIVISGYGESQKAISEFGKSYSVYLISGKQKILLNVREILISQYNLTQAILKPEINLTAGLEYELEIEFLKDSEKEIYRYNTSGHRENVKWIVNSTIDSIAPIWITKPQFVNDSYIMFGCGPSTYVNYNLSIDEDSDYLIKAIVTNKSTGKETSYYLESKDDIIEIGHGMCSGAFSFDDGDKFGVEFSLMDASGNYTTSTGEKYNFNRPIPR